VSDLPDLSTLQYVAVGASAAIAVAVGVALKKRRDMRDAWGVDGWSDDEEEDYPSAAPRDDESEGYSGASPGGVEEEDDPSAAPPHDESEHYPSAPPASQHHAGGDEEEWLDYESAPPVSEHDAPAVASAKPLHDTDGKPSRYLNARWRSGEPELDPRLDEGIRFFLILDIGALRQDSRVVNPTRLPEHVLPEGDVCVRLLVTSLDFDVMGGATSPDAPSGRGELPVVLPGDGGPARDSGGSEDFAFRLRVKSISGPTLSARVAVIFRNTVLQSFRLSAPANGRLSSTVIENDFTLSRSLGPSVRRIRPAPRLTVIANDSVALNHVLTVRAGASDGSSVLPPLSIALSDSSISDHVGELRESLAKSAPTSRKRQEKDLVRDLQRLCPLGWKLRAALPPEFDTYLSQLEAEPGWAGEVQVIRTDGSTFMPPLNLVYDIYLDSTLRPAEFAVCRIVHNLSRGIGLIPGMNLCPFRDLDDHRENILCPFGFWGFRYRIATLTSTDSPYTEIELEAPACVAVGATSRGVDAKSITEHVDALRRSFSRAGSFVSVECKNDRTSFRSLVEADLPIVYLVCHGSSDDASKSVVLTIGASDRIAPADITGWIHVARKAGRPIWRKPRPLVFINACASLAIEPHHLNDYLKAFVGAGNAAGVIGTEARVNGELAMEFAQIFFERFADLRESVDEALGAARLTFLADLNLFGLVYSSYCLGQLRLHSSAWEGEADQEAARQRVRRATATIEPSASAT
jgi:hypothetical protein